MGSVITQTEQDLIYLGKHSKCLPAVPKDSDPNLACKSTIIWIVQDFIMFANFRKSKSYFYVRQLFYFKRGIFFLFLFLAQQEVLFYIIVYNYVN